MAEYSGTPWGGKLKDFSARKLGSITVKETLSRSGVQPEHVDHVVFGNVIQDDGQAIYGARHVGLDAGIPEECPALTVNRLCGSGIQSVISGSQEMLCGDASIVVAGGMESMSRAPYTLPGAREGIRIQKSVPLNDTLLDGLFDSHCGYYMAQTADNCAEKYDVSREEQDEFAFRSHQLGAEAVQEGILDEEIVPVKLGEGEDSEVVKRDDHIKPDTSLDDLSKLPPAFGKDSNVTAGNASGMVDGGASLVISDESAVTEYDLDPTAEILNWSTVGVKPELMGLGPVAAIPSVLEETKFSRDDIDLFEINEAFAGQYLAVEKELDLDREKVNPCGGAIALGHPLGMTGTRLILTLVRELRRQGKTLGIASACIGGGQGIAMLVKVT